MEHVVFYPGADGTEAYRRVADLEEAVRLVEHLRNDNGIGDASVFALHAVPLAFRTYVHVELPVAAQDEPAAPVSAAISAAVSAEPSIPPPPPSMPPSEAELVEDVQPVEDAERVEDAEPVELVEWFEPEAEVAEPDDAAEVVEWVEPQAQLDESFEGFDFEAPPAPPAEYFTPSEEPQAELAYAEVEPEPVDQAELHESSASELPPLTLAPGPLLFDGDDTPIAATGAYDAVEETPAELTDLIPADFTDLIPKDIPHGDLARIVDGDPVEYAELVEYAEAVEPVADDSVAESPADQPAAEVPADELVAPEFQGEPAPSTDELPPMDVAEVPADVSSIEMLDAAPIPAAREAVEEPAHSNGHREGPRGLGFFGG